MDCGIDTNEIYEYYGVYDHVWLLANPAKDGMLCVGCLEKRLRRRLTPYDFTNWPINFVFKQSDRLRSRIYGEQAEVVVS